MCDDNKKTREENLEQVSGGMMTHLDRLEAAEQARKREEEEKNKPGGATGEW